MIDQWHQRRVVDACPKDGMMHQNGCAPKLLEWLMCSLFYLQVVPISPKHKHYQLASQTIWRSSVCGVLNGVDACRFAGAIPEVANSRLAMLGVVLGLGAEITTGEQCCDMTHNLQSGTIV